MRHKRIGRMRLASLTVLVLTLATAALVVASPAGAPRLAPSATELIENGSFEVDCCWEFGNTPAPANYVSGVAHEGNRSVLTGILPPGPDIYSFSSVYQKVEVPWVDLSDPNQTVQLSFWYKPGTQETAANTLSAEEAMKITPALSAEDQAALSALGVTPAHHVVNQDIQGMWLLDQNFQVIANPLRTLRNGDWTFFSYDLRAYRGTTIYVYFDTINEGDSLNSWMYVDQVSIQVATEPVHTPTTGPSPTVTNTPVPGAGQQIVVNPSFEEPITDPGGWIIGNTPRPARRTTAKAHEGTYSMLLGILPTTPDTYSYSSVRQRITIPCDASSAILHFWYWPNTEDRTYIDTTAATTDAQVAAAADVQGSGGLKPLHKIPPDAQMAIILDKNLAVKDILFFKNIDSDGWLEASYDIAEHCGEPIYIYFGVINDGDGLQTWMYLDQVTVTLFGLGEPTATPTATVTPTVTITPTETVTATVTPTATVTATVTPSPTATVAPYPAPEEPLERHFGERQRWDMFLPMLLRRGE